ncbi:MAG: hypothetical protein ACT4OI_01020, partial [Methanobacteriota archaeon]
YNVSVGLNYEIVEVVAETTTVAVLPSAGTPQTLFSYLWVRPNPSVATRISVDGVVRNEWELILPLDSGAYTISTSDVLDHATPDDIIVFVSRIGTTIVNPQFQKQGALRVVTDPSLPGTVFLDGVPANDWDLDLAVVGGHKISFGPVPGYSTPFGQFVLVGPGEVVSITGVYSLLGAGVEHSAPLEAVVVDWRAPSVVPASESRNSRVWRFPSLDGA